MKVINQYNGLNGETYTRETLTEFIKKAEAEGCHPVAAKLLQVLFELMEEDKNEVQIYVENPIAESVGLNAAQHTGLAKEALDECGRLKKGYKYVKGGKLEKVVKKDDKKKTAKPVARKIKISIKPIKKGSRYFYIPYVNETRVGKTNWARKYDAKNALKELLKNKSDEEILKLIKKAEDSKKTTSKPEKTSSKKYDIAVVNFNNQTAFLTALLVEEIREKGKYTDKLIKAKKNSFNVYVEKEKTDLLNDLKKLSKNNKIAVLVLDEKVKDLDKVVDNIDKQLIDYLDHVKNKDLKEKSSLVIDFLQNLPKPKNEKKYGPVTVKETEKNYWISFKYDENLKNEVKEIDGRSFDWESKNWLIPKSSKKELFDWLKKYKESPDGDGLLWCLLNKKEPGVSYDLEEILPTGWNHLKKEYAAIIDFEGENLTRTFIGDRKNFSSSRKNAEIDYSSDLAKAKKAHIIETREGSHKNLFKHYYRKEKNGKWSHIVSSDSLDMEEMLRYNCNPEEITLGLSAPWHARNTPEYHALDNCGYLKKGYRYKKGGGIEKVKKTSAKKKASKKKQSPKPKVNKETGQYALMGAQEKKALNAPEQPNQCVTPTAPVENVQPQTVPVKSNPKVRNMATSSAQSEAKFYNVPGETGKFLQRVERKPKESVAITLDAPRGAGKTTMIYQMMNDFSSGGNRSLFISLEEHPESVLAEDKRQKYIDAENRKNIDEIGEIESKKEFYDLIEAYDVIFIDSWQKVVRKLGKIYFDEELRKKFDGKVFVVIFQQTVDGKTKGGADIGFDGDIIIKVEKGENFAENYAWFDKNRYTVVPIHTIRYNIASASVYRTENDITDVSDVHFEEVKENEVKAKTKFSNLVATPIS